MSGAAQRAEPRRRSGGRGRRTQPGVPAQLPAPQAGPAPSPSRHLRFRLSGRPLRARLWGWQLRWYTESGAGGGGQPPGGGGGCCFARTRPPPPRMRGSGGRASSPRCRICRTTRRWSRTPCAARSRLWGGADLSCAPFPLVRPPVLGVSTTALAHGARLLDAASGRPAPRPAAACRLIPSTQLLRVRPHELGGGGSMRTCWWSAGADRARGDRRRGSVWPGRDGVGGAQCAAPCPCPVLLAPRSTSPPLTTPPHPPSLTPVPPPLHSLPLSPPPPPDPRPAALSPCRPSPASEPPPGHVNVGLHALGAACSSRSSQPNANPLPPSIAATAPSSRSSPRATCESGARPAAPAAPSPL